MIRGELYNIQLDFQGVISKIPTAENTEVSGDRIEDSRKIMQIPLIPLHFIAFFTVNCYRKQTNRYIKTYTCCKFNNY